MRQLVDWTQYYDNEIAGSMGALLSSVAREMGLGIVETVGECVSLYGRTAQEHHLAVLIKVLVSPTKKEWTYE